MFRALHKLIWPWLDAILAALSRFVEKTTIGRQAEATKVLYKTARERILNVSRVVCVLDSGAVGPGFKL